MVKCTESTVIGLTGPMGAGKSTAAKYLAERYGFIHLSFAEELRGELFWALSRPWSTAWMMARRGAIARAADLLALRVMHRANVRFGLWGKPTGALQRRLMQWWGTDYRRAESPDYWTDAMEERIRSLVEIDPAARIVIDDVRFPNEVALICRRGGRVYRLLGGRCGGDAGIAGHVSESAIAGVRFRVIGNNGSLEDLQACLRLIMRGMRIRMQRQERAA